MVAMGPASKVGVVAKLVALAAAGGAVVAGLALPTVGAVGIGIKSSANKFNSMGTPELGQLPVRSQIVDTSGHLLAYYYPRGIDRVPV
ncbi:MAG TPA: hypothetical protein VE343_03050, partial [Streptosporangiaceae bacterium]|nr:hypothetical protein [Streptosporangiaceae bacterium]